MNIQTLDIKKEITRAEVHTSLETNFNKLSSDWFMIQQYWLTNAYAVYRDHEKYLILFYLAKKVFEIYSSHYRILNWNEFFNIKALNVGKLSINEISRDLKISRETARRKIAELIKDTTIIKKVVAIIKTNHLFGCFFANSFNPNKKIVAAIKFIV